MGCKYNLLNLDFIGIKMFVNMFDYRWQNDLDETIISEFMNHIKFKCN